MACQIPLRLGWPSAMRAGRYAGNCAVIGTASATAALNSSRICTGAILYLCIEDGKGTARASLAVFRLRRASKPEVARIGHRTSGRKPVLDRTRFTCRKLKLHRNNRRHNIQVDLEKGVSERYEETRRCSSICGV